MSTSLIDIGDHRSYSKPMTSLDIACIGYGVYSVVVPGGTSESILARPNDLCNPGEFVAPLVASSLDFAIVVWLLKVGTEGIVCFIVGLYCS